MAVCGLASVDLSSLTGWQQAILFLQMCLGNPVCELLRTENLFLIGRSGLNFVGCRLC
jgi:hypothetical protein